MPADPAHQPLNGASAEALATRRPPFYVTVVCLGVQFMYLASASVVTPQSRLLIERLLHDHDATEVDKQELEINMMSGTLIGIQHIAFGVAVWACRYKYNGQYRSVITFSLCVSMAGSLLFVLGVTAGMQFSLSIAVLFAARLMQGAGAGIDYTAKHALTVLTSVDVRSVYYSYWSVACAVGTGFGPLLVFVASFLPISWAHDERAQCATPLLLLFTLEAVLLAVHFAAFPKTLNSESTGPGGRSSVISLPRGQRFRAVGVSLMLGFIRHLVRTAWESITVLVLETHYKMELRHVALVTSLFYLTSYPAQLLYNKFRGRLSEEGWMNAMTAVASVGTCIMWLGLVPFESIKFLGFFCFTVGSLFLYDGLAIHATVSDVFGVRYANPLDPVLNVENVIFAQIVCKGMLGRSLGPVVGRLLVVGQWNGFTILCLGLLGTSALLPLACFPSGSAVEREIVVSAPAKPTAAARASPSAANSEEKKQELRRRSMLHIRAVHMLDQDNWEDFMGSEDCDDFAKMKHGDPDVLRKKASQMAQLILDDAEIGKKFRSDPSEFRIIGPAFRKVPTVGVYLCRELSSALERETKQRVLCHQMRRKEITNGDFAAMDTEARKRALKGQFYLEEKDLGGKRCIFVDDAIMFGTHYCETVQVLQDAGASQTYGFFIVEASPELLSANDKVEHLLNSRFQVTIGGLQRLVYKAEFGISVRLLKLIRKQDEEMRKALVEWMDVVRPDVASLMLLAIKEDNLDGPEHLAEGAAASTPRRTSKAIMPPPAQAIRQEVVIVPSAQSTTDEVAEADPYEYLRQKFRNKSFIDPPLTKRGEEAARQLGARLRKAMLQQVGLVVVSPLQRCTQTAHLALQEMELPSSCRVVAHPLAAEQLFEPDTAENCIAHAKALDGLEVAGRNVEVDLCDSWASAAAAMGSATPDTVKRVSRSTLLQRCEGFRDFLRAQAPVGTKVLVFSHTSQVQALTGLAVAPGTLARSVDWLSWQACEPEACW